MDRQIYTHPIVLAYQKTGSLDANSIETGLFYSEAFGEILDICLFYLTKSKNHFGKSGAKTLYNAFSLFEDNTNLLKKYSQKLIEEKTKYDDVTQEIKKFIHPLLIQH